MPPVYSWSPTLSVRDRPLTLSCLDGVLYPHCLLLSTIPRNAFSAPPFLVNCEEGTLNSLWAARLASPFTHSCPYSFKPTLLSPRISSSDVNLSLSGSPSPRPPLPVPAYADSIPKSRNCFMDSGDGENLLKCSMYLGAPARDAFFNSARTQRMATAPAARAWLPLLSRGWRRWHQPSARPSSAGRRAPAASSLPLPWRCLQRLANRLVPAPLRRQWSRTNNSRRTNSLVLRHVALLGAHPLNREGAGDGLLFSWAVLKSRLPSPTTIDFLGASPGLTPSFPESR